MFTWGDMPWNMQFDIWRASFMRTCIVSFIVWNIGLSDEKSLIYFKWAFIISMVIAGIYGLFLMRMNGLNPYTTLVTNYFGIEDAAENYSKRESRLDFSTASKIQATMIHPMTWTLILCFTLIIFVVMYLKTKNRKLWLLIGLFAFNILISGVRTGIATLTIGIVYFLIRFRKFKLIFSILILLSLLTLIIQSNDSLSNVFASFIDVSGKKSDVQGSSIMMRLEQLQGSFDEIKGHELTGKGYGWTGYYISLNGKHPVILAFESLVFMVLCNSGYIGALVWIIFFILLYHLNRKLLHEKNDIYLMDVFIITYAAYATGTGDYGYISFFAIFYSFLLAYLMNIQRSRIIEVKKSSTKIGNTLGNIRLNYK
jgi:hypothetical protein